MLRGFADRSGVGCERKRRVEDAKSPYPLSNWKNGVVCNLDGKTTERRQVIGVKLLTCMLEIPISHPSEGIEQRAGMQAGAQGKGQG